MSTTACVGTATTTKVHHASANKLLMVLTSSSSGDTEESLLVSDRAMLNAKDRGNGLCPGADGAAAARGHSSPPAECGGDGAGGRRNRSGTGKYEDSTTVADDEAAEVSPVSPLLALATAAAKAAAEAAATRDPPLELNVNYDDKDDDSFISPSKCGSHWSSHSRGNNSISSSYKDGGKGEDDDSNDSEGTATIKALRRHLDDVAVAFERANTPTSSVRSRGLMSSCWSLGNSTLEEEGVLEEGDALAMLGASSGSRRQSQRPPSVVHVQTGEADVEDTKVDLMSPMASPSQPLPADGGDGTPSRCAAEREGDISDLHHNGSSHKRDGVNGSRGKEEKGSSHRRGLKGQRQRGGEGVGGDDIDDRGNDGGASVKEEDDQRSCACRRPRRPFSPPFRLRSPSSIISRSSSHRRSSLFGRSKKKKNA